MAVHKNALKSLRRSMTNRELSECPPFRSLCKLAGVEPTPRQASKFMLGRGQAYNGTKSRVCSK